ncbi:MAG: glutathione S-transferase family protein [Alphaproteobacteria bacterium]
MSHTNPEIVLHSYAMSPYAAKVHGMLNYKGLPFRVRYTPPLRAKKELPIGHQIPVVEIDGEARNDSTPIGLWLDERFPEAPRLLPEAGPERDKLLAIDQWATDQLIPATFRTYPGEGLNKWINGWKLSHVMHATAEGGLPWALKWLWPVVVTQVPFVKHMIAMASADGLSIEEAKFKLYDEFIAHLEGGSFIGGRNTPSLPDFSCYAQFSVVWVLGFRGADDILQRLELMAWLERMKPYVDGPQPITPRHVAVNELPVAGGAFRSPTSPRMIGRY